MIPGLNQPHLGRFVGQLKEYLEFQKNLGRPFLPGPKNQEPSVLRRPHQPMTLTGFIRGDY